MLGKIHQKRWGGFFALLLFSTWLCGVVLRASEASPLRPDKGHCQPDASATYTAWHLLLASVYSEEGCSALADDDSLDGQDTGKDVDIASIGESPQWVLGLHDLSSVCQKINPHTPPAAAQARLPRYLLFCCWKNDLA